MGDEGKGRNGEGGKRRVMSPVLRFIDSPIRSFISGCFFLLTASVNLLPLELSISNHSRIIFDTIA